MRVQTSESSSSFRLTRITLNSLNSNLICVMRLKLGIRRISVVIALLMLVAVLSSGEISRVRAANVLVNINCVTTGCPPNAEIDPNPAVLLRGVDTVSFSCNPSVPLGLGPAGAGSCQVNSSALGIATGNFVGTIGPFGPFNVQAGTYTYSIGSDQGSMAPPAGKCNNCDATISIVVSIPVGGQVGPLDKASLLAPYAALIGAFVAIAAVLGIYARRVIRGKSAPSKHL